MLNYWKGRNQLSVLITLKIKDMKTETLEQAKKLQDQIGYLKNEIKIFDAKQRYVYLQISDHYGNKGGVIKTYAFSPAYNEAAGYSFDSVVSDAYGVFLETVRKAMQERIDLLESQLLEL